MIVQAILDMASNLIAGFFALVTPPPAVVGFLGQIADGAAVVNNSVGALGVVFPMRMLGTAFLVWFLVLQYWVGLRFMRFFVGTVSKG